jgi:hypothetical protein
LILKRSKLREKVAKVEKIFNVANISEIIDLGSYNVLNNDTERIDRINR